jgi:hypothetical protein
MTHLIGGKENEFHHRSAGRGEFWEESMKDTEYILPILARRAL